MEQNQWETKRILIVVKTYPNKSQKYDETVCTAGVTEDGEWVRLYPIKYRFLERFQQYKKYQWVTLNVKKNIKDYRVDSYTPNLDTLIPGEFIDTSKHNGWERRKQILLPTTLGSMEEIMSRYEDRSISRSLGMFKPKEISDITFKPIPQNEQLEEYQNALQLSLFDDKPQLKKDLEPIDTHFYYEFRCDHPTCKGHRYSIIDWEAGQLWRNLRQRYDEDIAKQKFKDKWLGDMCHQSKDTHFIVGNKYRYPSFMVLGVFSPPLATQMVLF